MPRPWLFLDLDGVVSPVPPRGADRDEIPLGYMTWDGAIYQPMYVDQHLPAWAQSLDAAFDVVWATSWQRTVLGAVAEPLGLPAWPVLTWPLTLEPTRRQGGRGRLRQKTAVIVEHLRRDPRPFAWADDFHARRCPPPPVRDLQLDCLIIRPAVRIGLTAAHVDDLLAFAACSGSRLM